MKDNTNLLVNSTHKSTILGVIAILFWSTTIAFSRSLTEQLGTFTAASSIYILAGLFGLVYGGFQPGGLRGLSKLPRGYLMVCGGLFVLYMVSLYMSIGLATSRTQVITVGLINYLWPALSLVFSIPILKRRARPTLFIGILFALAGIWLVTASGGDLNPGELLMDKSSIAPFALALIAAISWALYSNLSRRLGGDNEGSAVPLFLLASGLLLGVFRVFVAETSQWSFSTVVELLYMAVFPGMLAYVLWDVAVRKGDIILVASLSYLTPSLSTLVSIFVLTIQPAPSVWIATALIIGGALICKGAINEEETRFSDATK